MPAMELGSAADPYFDGGMSRACPSGGCYAGHDDTSGDIPHAAAAPRLGGRVAAAWLCLGAVNLLLIPGHYGVVLCLVALAVGATALSFLADEFVEQPAREATVSRPSVQ